MREIGQLICGENTTRWRVTRLMAQGEAVSHSSWPPVWPTRRPADGVNYHIAAATRIRASAHCFEAKVFGLVTAGVLHKAARDLLVARDPQPRPCSTPRRAPLRSSVDRPGNRSASSLCTMRESSTGEIDLNRASTQAVSRRWSTIIVRHFPTSASIPPAQFRFYFSDDPGRFRKRRMATTTDARHAYRLMVFRRGSSRSQINLPMRR